MKKWMLVCAVLYSMTGFASPVSDDELKSVNVYLAEILESESPLADGEFKIVTADRDNKTKLLDSITSEFSFLNLVTARLALSLKSSTVLTVSGFAQIKDIYKAFNPEVSDEEFANIVANIKLIASEAVKKINELAKSDSLLKVAIEFSDVSSGFGITFAAFPQSGNGESEFNSLSVAAFYNTEKNKLNFGVGFDGVSSSDDLNQMKVYLSDIFNSLVNKSEPAQSDIDALIDSVAASYEKVSGQLSKYIDAIL